jgi:hypothetical protein
MKREESEELERLSGGVFIIISLMKTFYGSV